MTVLESRVPARLLIPTIREAGATEASCDALTMRWLDAPGPPLDFELELTEAPGHRARLSIALDGDPTVLRVRIELPEGAPSARVASALGSALPDAQPAREATRLSHLATLQRELEAAGSRQGESLTRAALDVVARTFEAGTLDGEAVLGELYGRRVPRALAEPLTSWLITMFRDERHAPSRWRIADVLRAHALPASAPAILELLRDARYGQGRQPLVECLTRLRPPGIAAELAALAHDEPLSLGIAGALGLLRADDQKETLFRLARDPRAPVRREAERALRALGEAPQRAAATHRVRGRAAIARGLEEWSANLEIEQLRPVLAAVRGLVGDGLAVDEIVGVVEDELEVEERATFRFDLGDAGELWVTVEKSDEGSPDLYLWAKRGVIARIEPVLSALLD